MAQSITIVGNWKMNQSVSSIHTFFEELTDLKDQLKCEAWIAPQFIHLPLVQEKIKSLNIPLLVGAQNCSTEEKGAFTGEVSPVSLKDLKTDFVIIGHSERRTLFQESNELLNRKVKAALRAGLKVIYCVGETLQQRKDNQTFEVLKEQITQGLTGLSAAQLQPVWVAYEPVWAIGTGETASPEQAQEAHAFLKNQLQTTYSCDLPLLYGGSVKPSNLKELLNQDSVNGALVGGASLQGHDFKDLCLVASTFL